MLDPGQRTPSCQPEITETRISATAPIDMTTMNLGPGLGSHARAGRE